MVDANANRAAEALRTLEDHARFLLDDAPLSESLKRLRHQLATAVATLARDRLLAARDTAADVGTELTTATERRRHSHVAVVAAAGGRAGEAIRVLEEAFKTVDPNVAAQIEQIRYRTYTASAAVELAIASVDRVHQMAAARIYALIGDGNDPIDQANRAIAAGVDVVQLRLKSVSDRTFLQVAQSFVEVCRRAGVLSIINDRADIAAATAADGVHVGQDELTVAAARRCIGPGQLVGVSTHDVDQVSAARVDGADYIGCGPVFPSGTKQFSDVAGTDFLRQVTADDRCSSRVCDRRDRCRQHWPGGRNGVQTDRRIGGVESRCGRFRVLR